MDEEQPRAAGREWSRILLICCCVIAAIAVGGLVGSFGSGGIAGSPIESALPGEQIYNEHLNPAGSNASGAFGPSGQLGALNPTRSTAVGGNIEGSSAFASTNTSIHFVVESSQPAYWRTGAYSEYTGSGWRQSGETESLDGPIQHEGISDEEIVYEVSLERPSAAVPTPWRPITVDSAEDLVVTGDGAVVGEDRFEEGTTFSGVSHQPERDPTLLRTSDGEYSSDVSQYTELPGSTPRRVGRFTDELTADADNPYETATQIQNWLRSEKGYSLDASRRSDSIADTFIFEMDRGYCEYFATAMTVMLRTQDIPARYVVGYSTGQHVGDGRYEVRGMNAHAWVEVYFEDFGWVKFDPTPGDSRLAVQEAALEETNRSVDFDPEEVGSPGEVFEPGEIRNISRNDDDSDATDDDPDANDTEDDGPSSDPARDGEGYDISFDPRPVPGHSVTVTVTYDGEPAGGRSISFNGQPVGVTDRFGKVTGTVPATEELVVDVYAGNAQIDVSHPAGGVTGDDTATGEWTADGTATGEWTADDTATGEATTHDQLPAIQAAVPLSTTGGFSGQPPRLAAGTLDPSASSPPGWEVSAGGSTGIQEANESEETFVVPVETNASLVLSGDVVPGSEVTVTALVGDVPVSNAAVTIDGELYGRTDDDGRARLLLPPEGGEKTIAVRRDLVTGNTTVTIPELAVDLRTDLPVTLPYGSVTVEARYDNRTIAGAPVFVDGERVATTGQDGTATLRLPPAWAASISVRNNGVETAKTIDGMLQHLLFGFFGILALAGSVVFGVRRTSVLEYLEKLSGATVRLVLVGLTGAIVTLATSRGTYTARFLDRVRITVDYVVGTATGRTSLGDSLTALQAWGAGKYRVATALASSRGADEPPMEGGDHEIASVQDGWRDFLGYVSVGDPTSHSPGEIARHAVDRDGLPPGAVATLRDSFRAVEYGSEAGDERVDTVRAALAEIRSRLDGHQNVATGGGE